MDPWQDAFWWQGSLMKIKVRAADTEGALGLVEGQFPAGFGPPLHIHRREDEGFYVIDGEIRFRQGDNEFVAGPGTWYGDRAASRMRSGYSRAVPGHSSSSRPEASSACSRRPACRRAGHKSHLLHSTT